MRRILLGAALGFAFVASMASPVSVSAADACPEFKARGALKVETNPAVLENFRLPIFEWVACESAITYNIYVNDALQASVEGQSTWRPTTEYAYGAYVAYVEAVLGDLGVIKGEATPFRIGISPPDNLIPNHKAETEGSWRTAPEFSFRGSRGAMGYEVKLTRPGKGDVVVCVKDIPTPEGRDGVEVKTYTCPMPDGTAMEPGEVASWRVSAWTKIPGDDQRINTVESEKAAVRIFKLNPPTNISPNNGFTRTVRSDLDKPDVKWTHELIEKGDDVVLEMHFIDPKTNPSGEPNPETDPVMTEVNAMITDWSDKESLETGRNYKWYVVAKKEGQQAIGEVWVFTLNDPIGLGIGIKLGGNMLRTTNPLSVIRLQPGGGIYVDFRIVPRSPTSKFQFRVQGEALIEGRAVGFNQADNPQFIVKDLHFTQLVIAPGLFAKPVFKIMDKLDLYGLAGVDFGLAVMSRIINEDATEKVVAQTNFFNFNLVFAVGMTYTFDVKYLFGRQGMEFGLEVRYTQGLLDFLNGLSFVGADPSSQTEFAFFITNKIVDF
jgi:hypothetical protein